jgi:hypothetical protein
MKERHVAQVVIRQHLVDQLVTIEAHIARSEMNVTSQRHRVHRRESVGEDASLSWDLLATFLASLTLRYQYRERILCEMAKLKAAQ